MISELRKKLSEDNVKKINNVKYDLNHSNINLLNKITIKCPNCNRCEYILNRKISPYCNLDCLTNYNLIVLKKK